MQRDEQTVVALIKRKSCCRNNCLDNKRTVIEYFGDGSLSIFSSITDALRCAIQIQEQLRGKRYRLHDYSLISIKVNKIFDAIRNEQSFKELMRKMGLE